MTLQKLNPLGIAHYLIPVAVFVLVGVGGGAYLIHSHAATPPDTLVTGQALSANQQLVSSSNGLRLVMQYDGNVVIYSSAGLAIWANNKSGSGTNNRLLMQADGNLVEYTASGRVVWANGKYGSGNNNRLLMQGDGNLVEYTASGAVVWNTVTYYRQFPQSDVGPYYYNSPGVAHPKGVGVQCPDLLGSSQPPSYDWCSNAASGTANPLWYGPYLNEPAPLYNFDATIAYYWTNPANVTLIAPGTNNTFTMSVTDNSGTSVLYSAQVAGAQHCNFGNVCTYTTPTRLLEPIRNLEIRASNVCPNGCGGDVLHIMWTQPAVALPF